MGRIMRWMGGWEAERVLGVQNLVDGIGPAGRQILHLLAQYLSMCLDYNDSQTTIFTFSLDTMIKAVVFTKDPINPQLCLQANHWVVGKNAVWTPRLKKKSWFGDLGRYPFTCPKNEQHYRWRSSTDLGFQVSMDNKDNIFSISNPWKSPISTRH